MNASKMKFTYIVKTSVNCTVPPLMSIPSLYNFIVAVGFTVLFCPASSTALLKNTIDSFAEKQIM